MNYLIDCESPAVLLSLCILTEDTHAQFDVVFPNHVLVLLMKYSGIIFSIFDVPQPLPVFLEPHTKVMKIM